MNDYKVFVPYPMATIISYNIFTMADLEIGKWCDKNIDYPVEFGYVNGRIMGIYLKSEDALAYKLQQGKNS